MCAVIDKLVFDLNADDGASIPVKQPLHLCIDLCIPFSDKLQIRRVVISQWKRLIQKPVRKATVPALSVCPGTDPQDHIKPRLLAFLRKRSQVKISREVARSLDLFMVEPENVGCCNTDPAGFHFAEFPVPVFLFISGKMVLPHDADPWLPSFFKIQAVDLDLGAFWPRISHVKVVSFDHGFLISACFVGHEASPFRMKTWLSRLILPSFLLHIILDFHRVSTYTERVVFIAPGRDQKESEKENIRDGNEIGNTFGF